MCRNDGGRFYSTFSCGPSGPGGQRPLPCGGPAEERRPHAPALLFGGPERTEKVELGFSGFSEPTCPPDADMVKSAVVDPL